MRNNENIVKTDMGECAITGGRPAQPNRLLCEPPVGRGRSHGKRGVAAAMGRQAFPHTPKAVTYHEPSVL